jgi:hypothetical protein
VDLSDWQKDLLRLLVAQEDLGRGIFYLACNNGGCGLIYRGIAFPGEYDRFDFRQLQDDKLIYLEEPGPNIYTGKPTQFGIKTVRSNFGSETAVVGVQGRVLPEAVAILRRAMVAHSLNAPALAKRVRAELKRRKVSKKVDRTTIYRICDGISKRPALVTVHAIITVLELSQSEALQVRQFFAPQGNPPNEKLPKK